MEVLKTYIVYNMEYQVLFECANNVYYITSTGAFGQRDMKLEPCFHEEAKKLIEKAKQK